MPPLPRSLALPAGVALFLIAGLAQGQEAPAPPVAPVMEAMADTAPSLPAIHLDSVRVTRRVDGPCGRPVPMPKVPPGGDAVEMPRVLPSPRTLPIPTIRCEPDQRPATGRPALRSDSVQVDTLAAPSVERRDPP